LNADDIALHYTLHKWGERTSVADRHRIKRLTDNSTAGQFSSLQSFLHDGDTQINKVLRANRYRSPAVSAFLEDFAQLADYRGESYRAALLAPRPLQALRAGQGAKFFDGGIQTSSVALPHASIWLNHLPRHRPDLKPVIMILDRSVPQKNISYGNGEGMVAVAPGAPLTLKRVVDHEGVTFALFSAADSADGLMTRLLDGRRFYQSTV
jgi:hypothetical protein